MVDHQQLAQGHPSHNGGQNQRGEFSSSQLQNASHQTQQSQTAPTLIVRQFYQKLKEGDVDEVIKMVRDCGLDLQNLRNDKINYEQTALFEACAFKD